MSNEQKNLALLGSASHALKGGNKEEAILLLKQILDADPSHELANGMLASVYAELQLKDRAVHYFQKVLDHHPANVLARFQLGVLLLTNGQPQGALNTLQPMLLLEDDFLGHFHSGLALDALGEAHDAQRLYRRAAQTMPTDHPLRENLTALMKTNE